MQKRGSGIALNIGSLPLGGFARRQTNKTSKEEEEIQNLESENNKANGKEVLNQRNKNLFVVPFFAFLSFLATHDLNLYLLVKRPEANV